MNPVEKYFTAERWYCAGGIAIGLIASSLALYFFLKVKEPFYSGMGWPFLVLGFFFLIICTGVFFRSPHDIARVNAAIEKKDAHVKDVELPRMDKVMRNFKVIILVEISLIVLSTVILFLKVSPTMKGAFTGILIMATLLLVFDYLADKRGGEYHRFLKEKVGS